MNVVIVEKRWLHRMRIKQMVNKAMPGAQVICFKNSRGIMAHAIHWPINVVFFDMNAKPMRDLVLLGRLQQLWPRLNIIFMTDAADNDLASIGFDMRVSGYIACPVTQARVIREFEHLRYF